eukprot:1944043-Pyramimonas_sp.AAC.1
MLQALFLAGLQPERRRLQSSTPVFPSWFAVAEQSDGRSAVCRRAPESGPHAVGKQPFGWAEDDPEGRVTAERKPPCISN